MSNYSMPTNITGYADLINYTNSITGHWFTSIIVLLVFIIAFTNLKGYTTSRAFAFSSFISAIVAILFKLMGVMNDIVFFLTIIGTGLAIVWLVIEKDG